MLSIQRKKILVIGDFMLDVYTFGDVHRISPEAPVPVLRVVEESRRPGGAGNAILNLVSLGMEVIAVGRVGNDVGGSTFLQEMAKERVDTRGVICDFSFQTPLKNRMIAAGQQLLRIDYERPSPLKPHLESEVVASLPKLLEKVEIVAISDYAKGFLTPSLLSSLIGLANQRGIPVIVDPKGIDFTRYHGATLIKPNLLEAVGAAGLGMEATLDDIASRIMKTVTIDCLMVTRSKEGISVFQRDKIRQDFPAHVHEVKDVTGAGDTVLAIITAALANRLSIAEAAKLANIAAGIAIERVGCARISLSDLAARLVEIDASVITSK
jgi:D-beta-D-heptose 7-phosphate kinase/D-beta-D-heptose 1-phosphate adenosyltransferase